MDRVNDGASSNERQSTSALTSLSNAFTMGKTNDIHFDLHAILIKLNTISVVITFFSPFAVSFEDKRITKTATMAEKTLKFNRFASFFLDQLSADITFIVGPENCPMPEKIPAHKIVLASCSPVFNAMFFGSLPEQSEIRIIDVSANGFKEFLEYFYHDEKDVTKHKCIVEVMYLAEKYEVSGCLAAILPFLMKSDPVVCLELVAKCEFPELQEISKQMIIEHHTEFFGSESFLQYGCDVLKMILAWDEVKVHGEEIFMACYRWAENTWKEQQQKQQQDETNAEVEPTPADIRAQMNDFFDLIEFSTMKSHVLVTKMVKYADFFTKSDLVAIHKVLAIKYPAALDNLLDYTCDLKADDQEHIIKKIESITFESSKKLFFIDYHVLKDISLSGTSILYPYIMTLSKKSLANGEKEIVLMRKNVRSSFSTRSSDDNTIVIQPNTKYEIRLLFPNFTTEQKLCVPTAYMPDVCDLEDDEKVTIEGNSIISGLQFKY